VRALGVAPARDPLPILVSDAERDAACAQLPSLGWDGVSPLVGVAPGAAYGTAKQWPPEYFATLIAELHDRDGATAALLGTSADAPVGGRIAARVAEHTVRRDLDSLAAAAGRPERRPLRMADGHAQGENDHRSENDYRGAGARTTTVAQGAKTTP
jgi:hypothetical protein